MSRSLEDVLHNVLGYSNETILQFIDQALQKPYDDYITQLQSLSISPKIADEIYQRRNKPPTTLHTTTLPTTTLPTTPTTMKDRRKSRYSYLKNREEAKLVALEEELRDEETLFEGVTLTEYEHEELDRKRRLLELARKRKEAQAAVETFSLPSSGVDEDGHAILKDRTAVTNRRDSASRKVVDEHARWEEQQLLAAGVRFEKSSADALVPEESPAPLPAAAAEDMLEARRSLPMFAYRDELLSAVRQHQVVVVVASVGSGKTTQIPQYLLEDGYAGAGKKVACTQPRRVAAMSVAKRVADEMGVRLGGEVGYSIRFDECTSERTLIKYMTDGMLLREFMSAPDLGEYSVLMVDEAHERSLHTDILFGLIKDIARYRPEFKLVISSATLDAEKFSAFFDGAPILTVPGRRFPVDVYYTAAPEADYVDAAVVTTLQIHATQPPGDVLVFLTGQDEVEAAAETLAHRTRALGDRIGDLVVTRIYAALPSDQQARIFEPTPEGARKVVLATNIAETSLTIDGIVYVIDSGFSKQTSYDARAGMDSLLVAPISRASADQRAGRAGRTRPGRCFRLYTRWSFENELPASLPPEIQRTNLTAVVLLLKSMGINDLVHFDFMDPPPAAALMRSLEELYALGALNASGQLTRLGRRMADLPLNPMLAKMILASERYGCSDEAVSLAAMLSVSPGVFYRPKDRAVHADNAHRALAVPSSDHLTLLAVYNAWRDADFAPQWCFENFCHLRALKRARDVRDQLVRLLDRVEVRLVSNPADPTAVLKATLAGFFYHTARLEHTNSYRSPRTNIAIHIHPSSVIFSNDPDADDLPSWVLYHELIFTSKEFMRQVSSINPSWLLDIAPHLYTSSDIQ